MSKAQSISQFYHELVELKQPSELIKQHSFAGLSDEDIRAVESKGAAFYRGKVRDLLIDETQVRMMHTDRLTAFDKFICLVPYKGIILNAMNAFWLKKVGEIVPTHFISAPNARDLIVEKTTPFKIEVVVRAYLAGSMARAYVKGEREFCGEKLGDLLTEHGKLPELIITPTTKAAVFEHDENIRAAALIRNGVCSEKEWEQISRMAKAVFRFGSEELAKRGWILVDTKYEFGRNSRGEVILIDEVHTPDSSRFWRLESYEKRLHSGQIPEMLDKEVVRRWLMAQGFSGEGKVPEVPVAVIAELAKVYLQVTESLLGREVLVS